MQKDHTGSYPLHNQHLERSFKIFTANKDRINGYQVFSDRNKDTPENKDTKWPLKFAKDMSLFSELYSIMCFIM